MAKVTSSRDRSKGQAKRPVTSSSRRPTRQRNSNAQVTNSENRPSRGDARVTRSQDARYQSGAGRVDDTNVGPKSTGRSLPGEGGTSGNSPKARNEAGWARDRGAKLQARRGLTNLARGAARMAGVDRYSQASRKADAAAAGTQGEGVREGRPRPEITRSQRGGATDARIEPVRVREIKDSRSLPSGDRPSLPEGRRGGDATRSEGGDLARRQRPYPRPGGSVVVDESPRLPEGKRGGDLARTGGPEVNRRQPRLPADSRGSGTRIGNSSQPWGDRPSRSESPKPPSSRALPPGRTEAAQGSGGSSGGGGGSAAQSAGRIGAKALLGRGLAVLETARTAQKVFNPKDNILTGLQDLGSAVYNSTTPKGGAKKRYISDNKTARKGNERNGFSNEKVNSRFKNNVQYGRSGNPGPKGTNQLRSGKLADIRGTGRQVPSQDTSEDRPSRSEAPSRPSRSDEGSSGGYTPASRQRPSAGAQERPSRSSGPEPGTREWKDFNPGRGTSRTNNPLLKNDEYLMGKIRQREQSAAQAVGSKGYQIKENLAGDLKIPDGTEAASKSTSNRTKEAYSSSDLRSPKDNYNNMDDKEKKRVRKRYYD